LVLFLLCLVICYTLSYVNTIIDTLEKLPSCASFEEYMENTMTEIIQKYFQAWIDADIRTVKEIFCDDIIYSECYGPEYHGLSQIIQWFEEWNNKGRALEWTIKQIPIYQIKNMQT